MKKIIIILILLFVGINFSAVSQEPDPCKKSTEGTDFWFGFMESRWHSNNHKLEITVTAREATTFEIFYGPDSIPLAANPIPVDADNQTTILIDDELVEAKGSEIIENKGILLISKKPVNVYALNYDRRSSDVAVIYPTASLGTEYFAICYEPNVNGKTGKNSEFLIVATEDATTIDITPSMVTDQKKPKDTTFTITLNKGQVYQVQSENIKDAIGEGDLTGSHILADKPVALFSGSYGTTIPATQGTSAWDHLYEQIPPVHSWGRKFYNIPLIPRQGDIYRILAAEDNTKVVINNSATPIELDKGEFYEVKLENYDPSYLHADKKILVAQYSRSMSADAGTVGDPFMIILSPATQAVNDVTFVAYSSSVITQYYINIVARTAETSQILLDGNSIQNHFKPYANSEYSYAQISLNPETYHIWGKTEKIGFLAYVYGFGNIESYGYGVGFNLDLTLDLGGSIDFENDTSKLCFGERLTLDAGPYFDTYVWNTEETTQQIIVDKEGTYSVKTTTTEGCNLEDSVYVLVSSPTVEIGDDDEGCSPHSIELDATDNFEKYVWQNKNNDTLSTEQKYIASQTDEYHITVYNEYNCPARDTMNLVVFPVPKIKIDGETLICGAKISELSVSITDTPDSVWNYDGSFTWSSDNPALTFSEETHTSAKIEVTDWGEYKIYYDLKTINNCFAGDTFLVRFHQTPTSYFDYVDNPDDECEGYYREVLYGGNATQNADFYWDYGGSKVIDSIDWNNFTVSLGAYNSNPFLQLFVEEDGCWSDTTIRSLGANPDFILETEKARGCDSLTVLFKGTLGVEDSLLFEWDFGDGSPISNLQEVEHFYSEIGFYDVSLLITNLLSGCQIGFQIDSMIKVFPTPTAAITADQSFCYPDSADVIYTHNIDSSICYWDFEGAHQSGNGNDSITVILDNPFGNVILTV
ncbi:MAG: PKD domain-containing protein, partial [Draconibacterium sp.]|nr:PKD domain-containing protein [Draconibacterium sp.]